MQHRHPDEGVEKKGKAVVTRRTPHLLDEIVEQILLTHPASSLLQLRSVCRSWRTLISSSRFVNEHLRRSIFLDPTLTHPRIAYYSFPCKYPTIGVFSVRSLSDNKPTKVASFKAPRYFTIYGSCNGLLCLVHETDTGVMTCILWNPCTGSTSEPAQKITGGFGFYGLGYDHISDRYKLIGYLQSEESRIYSTRIYTFAPNSSWRTIPIEDDVDFTLLGHPPNKCPVYDEDNMEGVFVSNTLNWIVIRYCSIEEVLSFDLGKETYCFLPLPERDPEDDPFGTVVLSVLRNCLAVCFDHKRTHWGVWLMKGYGVTQSWTRLAIIPHPVGYNPNKNYGYGFQPRCLSENDVLLAISPAGKIVLCNLNNKDGTLLVPIIDGSGDGMERCASVDASSRCFIFYHESLVSLSNYGIASKRPLIKPNKPTVS